jgi:hypothetical protein
MTVLEGARSFFSAVRGNPDAAQHLEPYPDLVLHLLAPGGRVVVSLADGAASAGDANASVGVWGLELEADEEVFASIFDGERTLGESIYAGLLFVPEEKSKHNLVAAVGQAIRIAQSDKQGASSNGDN